MKECNSCGIEIDTSSFYEDMCDDCARNEGFMMDEEEEE